MGLLLTLRIALRALIKNKLRASLTVLGVVIGIAAVTTMVSIGQSASGLVQGELQNLGTNVIVILPASKQNRGVNQGLVTTLTDLDANSLTAECPSVVASTPLVAVNGGQLIYGNSNWSPDEMWGVGVDYLGVRNWPLRYGGFFTQRDIDSAAKVCVIGHTLVGKLFQTTDPLGKSVRIKNIPFQVIGVLEPKGANMVGQDQDNVVLLPYTTVRKRLYGSEFSNVNAIMASARSLTSMADASLEVKQLLSDRHRIRPGEAPDFEVQSSDEMANVVGIVLGTMTMMLASIAGISLVVGGVGIMNIMLVSVTERTREIGIRMAVGASSFAILLQFLVEAVVLSCIGGLFGFLLGVSASTGATMLINAFTTGSKWPVVISIPAAVMAFVFAASVGVFFGFFPAYRASRLDPIDALRYE